MGAYKAMSRLLPVILISLLAVSGAAAQNCSPADVYAAIAAEPDLQQFQAVANATQVLDPIGELIEAPEGATLFLPNDAAFERVYTLVGATAENVADVIPLGKILSILANHVIPFGFAEADLVTTGTLETLLVGYSLDFADRGTTLQITAEGSDITANAVETLVTGCGNVTVIKVDKVLLPALSVDDIPDFFNLTDNIAPAPAQEDIVTSVAVSPSASAGAAASEPCETDFLTALASEVDLSLLGTAVQFANFADKLPDPGTGVTLFAPVDDAFTTGLASYGLQVSDVVALGPKLQSLLLYHLLPKSYTGAELVAASPIESALGAQLMSSAYPITVKEGDKGVIVSGVAPNNNANVLRTIDVCSSKVHVVDSVLIPVASIQELPSPPASK